MGAANESIRKPSASGELTRLLLRYADATGVDPEGLAARAGLALDELDHPEARVAAGPFFALLQAMAEQAGDGAFGLRLGEAAIWVRPSSGSSGTTPCWPISSRPGSSGPAAGSGWSSTACIRIWPPSGTTSKPSWPCWSA